MTCFICQEKIMSIKDQWHVKQEDKHRWQLVVLLLKVGNKDRFNRDRYKSLD